MSQLSKPYRFALGALVVLVVAWFLVLRPGGGDDAASVAPPPQAPGVSGLTADVAKAKDAAGVQTAADARTRTGVAQASGGEATTTTSTSDAPKTPAASGATPASDGASEGAGTDAETGAGAAAPVLRALDRGDVAVLSFLGRGADDAGVREALARLTGPVSVRTASIDDLAEYAAITRGVPVTQAPTTLVISAGRTARVLEGYTTATELQQLVDDQAGR